MDDPDMIARVYGDADDGADNPVVRQRLGPRRIDAIGRHLLSLLVAAQGGGERRDRNAGERCSHQATSDVHSPRRISGSATPAGSTPSTSTSPDPIMKST